MDSTSCMSLIFRKGNRIHVQYEGDEGDDRDEALAIEYPSFAKNGRCLMLLHG